MTNVKFEITRKVYENGEWTEKTVTCRYQIEWRDTYARIRNEDGFLTEEDIDLRGLDSKEERMGHVVKTLKSWG